MAQEEYVLCEWKDKPPTSNKILILLMVVGLILGLAGLGMVIAGGVIQLQSTTCNEGRKGGPGSGRGDHTICDYSSEAKRVHLDDFLLEVKATYYKMNPNNIVYDPDSTPADIKEVFSPYSAHPDAIKKRTDTARELYREAKALAGRAKQDKLKPRELKALAQVQHFLQSNFGSPYDENYYAGDWMLGPNKFCWQPICGIGSDLRAHFSLANAGFQPKSVEDMNFVLDHLKKLNDSVVEYINNMKYGIKAGFVRSVEECQDGFYSIQRRFMNIYQLGPHGKQLTIGGGSFSLFASHPN